MTEKIISLRTGCWYPARADVVALIDMPVRIFVDKPPVR